MYLHHHPWRRLLAGAFVGLSFAGLSAPMVAHASMDADDMAKSRWTYVTQKRKNHHAHVWKLAYFEPYYTDQDNTSYYTIGWWMKGKVHQTDVDSHSLDSFREVIDANLDTPYVVKRVLNNHYHHVLITSLAVALLVNPLVGSAAIVSGGHHGVTSTHGSRSFHTSRSSFHSPTRSGGFHSPSSHGVTDARHFTTTRNFRSPVRSTTGPKQTTNAHPTESVTTPKPTGSTSHLSATTETKRPAIGSSSANRDLIHSAKEQRSYNHWSGYYQSHYPHESANNLFDHLWFWIPMWLLVRSQATGQASVNVPTAANGQAQHWIKVGSKVVFVPTDIWAKVQPGDHVKLIDDQHLSINGKIYQR